MPELQIIQALPALPAPVSVAYDGDSGHDVYTTGGGIVGAAAIGGNIYGRHIVHSRSQRKSFFTYKDLLGDCVVACYDHVLDAVTDRLNLGGFKSGDKTHNIRGLAMDSDGYLYTIHFWGGASQTKRIRRTTNPYDISAWDAETDIAGTGGWNYQSHVITSDDMLAIASHDTADAAKVKLKVYDIGEDSWGDAIQLTGTLGVYFQLLPGLDKNIHMLWSPLGAWSTVDAYYMQSATGVFTQWETADGTELSLPITARGAGNGRIYATTGNGDANNWAMSHAGDLAIDSLDRPMCIFPTSDGMLFMRYAGGSAWRDPVVVTDADNPFDSAALIVDDDRHLRALCTIGEQTGRGGELWQFRSSDGGVTWDSGNCITRGQCGVVITPRPHPIAADRTVEAVVSGGRNSRQVCLWGSKQTAMSPVAYVPKRTLADFDSLAAAYDFTNAATLTKSGNNITAVADLGPNGYNLAVSGTLYPTHTLPDDGSQSLNGHVMARFSTSLLTCTDPLLLRYSSAGTGYIAFLMAIRRDMASYVLDHQCCLMDYRDSTGDTKGWGFWIGNTNPNSLQITCDQAGAINDYGTGIGNGVYLVGGVMEPGAISHTYRNGKVNYQKKGFTTNLPADGTALRIGAYASGQHYFDGHIAEIVFLAGSGAPQEFVELHEYFMAKYMQRAWWFGAYDESSARNY